MITLEFDGDVCNECDCCMIYMEALSRAGDKHAYVEKLIGKQSIEKPLRFDG